MAETNNKRVANNTVNVLFSALIPAHKNITFAASTLKQKSYAEKKSIIRKSTICISCAVRLRI